MASPTQNAVGSTSFSPSSAGIGRYVTYGVKWGGAFHTGVTLPYSFPGGPNGSSFAYHINPYGQNEWNAWSPFTAAERGGAVAALQVWAGLGNVKFYETYDNQTYVGELRFTRTNMSDFAHCYYPGGTPQAGDGWYSQAWHTSTNETLVLGKYDFLTLLHEIGHALGLKHPFDGPNVMPVKYDSYFYSIMSYTASPWSAPKDNYASFYPTTPMYYDLVAIQAIYGRNPSHHSGNTTYSFKSTGTYFQTIDDASGSADKIVYSGSTACEIDLRPGAFSSVGKAIKFTSESSSYTVCIGPNTIIERAYGGSGSDRLIGNTAANYLTGNGGNDSISGNSGNDKITGGSGKDRANGGSGNDTISGNSGDDRLTGSSGIDHLYGGSGNDFLTGGSGRDYLTGGLGVDRFDYNAVSESKRGSTQRDQITDFHHSQHDRIDLASIDADTSNNPGNDVFKFIGSQRFHGGGGEVRFSGGIVQADVNGDKVADLEIKLSGVSSLHKGDFYL